MSFIAKCPSEPDTVLEGVFGLEFVYRSRVAFFKGSPVRALTTRPSRAQRASGEPTGWAARPIGSKHIHAIRRIRFSRVRALLLIFACLTFRSLTFFPA